MSVEAMRWVYAQRAPALAKAVLVNLAWHANDQGIAWPSQTTIAKECGMSVSAVKRHLHTLEGLGLIGREVRVREHQVNDANRYQLVIPTRSVVDGYPSRNGRETRPVVDPYPFTDDVRPVQQRTGTRSPVNPEIPEELPREVPVGVSDETPLRGEAQAKVQPLPKPKPKYLPVDDEYIAGLVAEFGEWARDSVANALNHKARSKYDDQRLYVRGWVRRDAEKRPGAPLAFPVGPAHRNGHAAPAPKPAVDPAFLKYAK